MIGSSMLTRRIRNILAVVGILASLGCSDDGLGKRYPVSGNVTYKGKPLAKGTITFVPSAPEGRGANGDITAGTFSLTTQTPDDGAFPGSYKVLVTDKQANMSKVDEDSKKFAAKSGQMATQPDPASIARAYKSAKNTVPSKYSSSATSPLSAEVKAESNAFDFPLED